MKKELYLFIIWHNARYKEDVILEDISSKFDIAKVFEINWSKDLFTQNLSRLYGKKLIKAAKKCRQVGRDNFLAITAYDNNPQYQNGKNLNILKAKSKYREITGGGHLVHASDNPEETEENLLLLLGLNIKEFEKRYKTPWNKSIVSIKNDLVATDGWKNENLFIKFINKLDNCHIEKGKILDIIKTDDTSKLCRLINASSSLFGIMNLYNVPIEGNKKLLRIENRIN